MNEKDIEQARNAQALMDNPLLSEVLTNLKQSAIEEWMNSPRNATEDRERFYLMVQAIEEFSRALRIVIENGKITTAILKRRYDKDLAN